MRFSETPHSTAELKQVDHMISTFKPAPNMNPYICISERKTKTGQLTRGRIYWLDKDTEYTDAARNTLVTVYKDAYKQHLVGSFYINRFEMYMPTAELRFPLLAHINSDTGLLLLDILHFLKSSSWPENEDKYNFLRTYIRDAIEAKGCNKPENMYKEYLILSVTELYNGQKNTDYLLLNREDLEGPCIVQLNPTDYFE